MFAIKIFKKWNDKNLKKSASTYMALVHVQAVCILNIVVVVNIINCRMEMWFSISIGLAIFLHYEI